MTLTIDISPQLEIRLKQAASRLGVGEAEYARKVIENDLAAPPPARDQATLDLFAQWKAESEASDPAQVSLAQSEWEEFRKAMNEDSLSGRPIYP